MREIERKETLRRVFKIDDKSIMANVYPLGILHKYFPKGPRTSSVNSWSMHCLKAEIEGWKRDDEKLNKFMKDVL